MVTLISSKCSDEIVSWKKDSHGRIVSILIRSNGVEVNLVNIYAPTNLAERKIFFDSLHEFFIPSDAIIIGGDFNCYDNVLDKFGGNISIHKEYESLKNDFTLVEICIPAQGNLRGSIRPCLSGVDLTSFWFQGSCCHPAWSATSHLVQFPITILFPLFLTSPLGSNAARVCGILIIPF